MTSLSSISNRVLNFSFPLDEVENSFEKEEEITEEHKKQETENEVNFITYSEAEIRDAISTLRFRESSPGYAIYMGGLRQKTVFLQILHFDNKRFRQEVKVLSRLTHPNLVTILGEFPKWYAVVYEFLPGGTLSDRLDCRRLNKPPLKWQDQIRIASEICCARVYLHSHKPTIIHGELRPSTILFDENDATKLSLFGLSFTFPVNLHESHTQRDYEDPIYLHSGRYTTIADVYSFGAVVLRLLTNSKLPSMVRRTQVEYKENSMKGLLDSAAEWPSAIAKDLFDLACRCCDRDWRLRPDLATEVRDALERMKESMVADRCSLSQHMAAEVERSSGTEMRRKEIELQKNYRGRRHDEASKREKELGVQERKAFTTFSLLDIQQATDNFCDSNRLGQGGFGKVYRGNLRGIDVAIKMLKNEGDAAQVKAFQHEVDILSRVNHQHLVCLTGACPDEYALVYEFMHGGTLEDRLNRKDLPWEDRLRIAAEFCSALTFLHTPNPDVIVHGDLKPANVLLDVNGTSKLTDFGISRRLILSNTTDTLHHTTDVKGTNGYIDPVFIQSCKLAPSVDVYAFGMLLLCLLTNQPPWTGLMDDMEDAMLENRLADLLDATVRWPLTASRGIVCCRI